MCDFQRENTNRICIHLNDPKECYVNYYLNISPVKNYVYSFLKKLKITLPYDLAIPLLVIYLSKTKSLYQRHICTPCSLRHVFQFPRYRNNLSTHQRIKGRNKENVIYTHDRILFSHKKKGSHPFMPTWKDLEGFMQSEICRTEKNKYCMIPLTGGIIPKKHNQKRGQICGYQRGTE